jgi:selenocysteine lyase/cysteine desulfurase
MAVELDLSANGMKLAKDKLFFSYATVAPMCEASYLAVKSYLDDFYRIGPPEALAIYDPMYKDLSREAARLLNCGPEEIAYIKNTSEGVILASEALPLDKGDELLVMGNEYPANLLPWLKKRKDGVDVKVIGGRDNAKAFRELIESVGPRTKAIAISSTQCYDGFTADLKLLSRLCRENDIFLVVDAVQTVGIRKIDLRETPVDFLICGGQKYLQAGPGIGFMYVSNRVIPHLRDTKVGIRSMQHFDESGYTLKNSAERFLDGTQNLAGIVALIAALKRVNEVGIEEIERRNLDLLRQIKDCFKRYDIPFIDHGSRQGNIVALTVSDPTALMEYMKSHGAYIKTMKDVVRVSFVHESRMEDVEALAGLIRQWLDETGAASQ